MCGRLEETERAITPIEKQLLFVLLIYIYIPSSLINICSRRESLLLNANYTINYMSCLDFVTNGWVGVVVMRGNPLIE